MIVRIAKVILPLLLISTLYSYQINFDEIFPLPSYKKVIDTCMRLYSDLLLLEERAAKADKYDDLVDIVAGRMVRLQSYTGQLVNEYKQSRSITLEDLHYLYKIMDYMEITASGVNKDQFPLFFNRMVGSIKTFLYETISGSGCA